MNCVREFPRLKYGPEPIRSDPPQPRVGFAGITLPAGPGIRIPSGSYFTQSDLTAATDLSSLGLGERRFSDRSEAWNRPAQCLLDTRRPADRARVRYIALDPYPRRARGKTAPIGPQTFAPTQ